MPKDSHPMCQLDTAILVLERESEFRKGYDAGMKKDAYWEPMLEDSLNILAWMPEIAAYIYRKSFDKGPAFPRIPTSTGAATTLTCSAFPIPRASSGTSCAST